MNGMGDDKVIKFIKNDCDVGVVEIVIVRKNQQMVSGFGDIGIFLIVMEDIVVGLININIMDIKMIDLVVIDIFIVVFDIQFLIDLIIVII